jgi:hypothetical protein
MRYHRHVMLGLVVAGLHNWGLRLVLAGLVSAGSAMAQTSVSVTKTTPVQPSKPVVTPTQDWKQWCDGQLAAARASQEGYTNWQESLGLTPAPVPVATAAPSTGLTAANVQALGSGRVWPPPVPQQSVHDLVAALAKQVGIYVVLPDPTLTYDAEHNLYIVCPEGTVYSGTAPVAPTPQ